MEQEYIESTMRFKRMKQKTMGVSVEKIIEKRRQMMKEVKSSYLPLITQSAKNQ
jgi:hypothetical protein